MNQDEVAAGTAASHPQSEAPDVRRSIYRASLLLMASILLSRVIGFFRDWILAQTVGANSLSDVYLASFTIPDFLNSLMASGALSVSFIPMLSGYLASDRPEQGGVIYRALATWMGSAVLLAIVLCEIFAGQLSALIAPGFTPEQASTLTWLVRIILPAQFFFFWGSLAIAVQHTHGRFLLPALAPIFYNLGIISFGLLLNSSYGVAGFSVGVLVGAFVSHGITQFIGIRKLGYSALPSFALTPEIKVALRRYFWMTFPIMFGFTLVVTDEWISKYFASSMEMGALSWLSYARTEMRIPIAVIGQVAGIASFPYLSRLWSAGHFEAYGKTLLREIQKMWAAAPIAAVLLISHALPITHFIYGGGRFTDVALQNTAAALQLLGIGVFFWTVQGLLSRGFYAAERTWLPSLVGTGLSIATVPLYYFLGQRYSFRGLALAGSLAILVYAVVLWGMLKRHLKAHAPNLDFAPFYRFASLWALVIAGLAALSEGIMRLGIYQNTRATALADVLLVTALLGGISLLLLRTVFKKLTDGPLF